MRIYEIALLPNLCVSYFASLGALSDFADSLVDFAYERQTQCDILNEPYYYECIQAIAKQRGSDELQLKTIMLESKGLVSRRALSEAYKYFDLPADGGGADDERIYNIFQAQHADLGAEQQERARIMLDRIGRRRNSKLLINAASQIIETAQEAYAWLGSGLGPETDDSFVVTIFSLRVSPSLPVANTQALANPARAERAEAAPQQSANLVCRPMATKTLRRSERRPYQ
jgi:ubiquitin carboxyl-terminal hydrolase 25/28